MLSDGYHPPLQVFVGHFALDVRMEAGLLQSDVAQVARTRGLRWSRSTVAAMERGAKALSAGTLLSLRAVLSDVRGSEVTLDEMVEGWELPSAVKPIPEEAEHTVSRRLGIPVEQVQQEAQRRWGCSLVEHRDRLAADGSPQYRGRVTRWLIRELAQGARP